MQLDLYHAETLRIASEQTALLEEARQILILGNNLSRLEQNGVLHTLQVLIENAIGKSKHILKAANEPVPISAYDAFDALERHGKINKAELEQWNAIIGLRNRIVHDYMTVNMPLILQFIVEERYLFIREFLCKPIVSTN